MSDIRVAVRYAKALLLQGEKDGSTQILHSDMQLLKSVCDNSRDLYVMLKNPIVHLDKKYTVLKRIFEGQVSNTTLQFFGLLCHKGREGVLYEVSLQYIALYEKSKGIQSATVKTAVPLTDDLRMKFVQMVQGISKKQVDLKEVVDPNIIGGFILNIDDKQIDESVSGKLAKLRTSFAQA